MFYSFSVIIVFIFLCFCKRYIFKYNFFFNDVLNDFIIIIIIIKYQFSVLQNILLSFHVWGLSMHLYFLVLSTNSLLYL